MKNTKKNYLLMGLIYLIICVLLNMLIFVIFKPKNIEADVAKRNFWLSYAFLMASFILQFATLFTLDRRSGIDAIFMGLPLYVISIGYLVIQLFVSLVFMILSAFEVKIPTTIVVVLLILLLGAYLVIALMALLAKSYISGIDQTIKTNVRSIRELTSDLEVAAAACQDEEVKKVIKKYSEDIRFSDPMTVAAVADLDENIRSVVSQIKNSVYDNNYSEATRLVQRGKLLLLERNNKIANSK